MNIQNNNMNQRPLSIMYGIRSLTDSVHLTADMIPFCAKQTFMTIIVSFEIYILAYRFGAIPLHVTHFTSTESTLHFGCSTIVPWANLTLLLPRTKYCVHFP
jgi:hypothetical protein